MIDLNGAAGGGQILRSALSLSLITGQPFRLTQIRGARPKPGLARQHLACVEAATAISSAQVSGAELGSTELEFVPGEVRAGDSSFAISSAGSALLLAQTLLLPLALRGGGPSTLRLQGGTHNPLAPPFEFVDECWLPLLRRMGLAVEARLIRPGFSPAGGGIVEFSISPVDQIQPLHLTERGEVKSRGIEIFNASLPDAVPAKQSRLARQQLGWPEETVRVVDCSAAACSGNAFALRLASEQVVERFTTIGAYGIPSQQVVGRAVHAFQNYLNSGAVVASALADQLLLPLALAGSGTLHTLSPDSHLKTNAAVIETFLPISVTWEPVPGAPWVVKVGPRG